MIIQLLSISRWKGNVSDIFLHCAIFEMIISSKEIFIFVTNIIINNSNRDYRKDYIPTPKVFWHFSFKSNILKSVSRMTKADFIFRSWSTNESAHCHEVLGLVLMISKY